MDFVNWVYGTSPWLVSAILLLAALALSTLGLLASYWVFKGSARRAHAELSTFTVSNIAVLYAVLLAFIAIATWESFSKAGEIVQTEANLIGNLARDSKGMPAPFGDDLRSHIGDYLHAVIETEWPAQQQGRRVEAGWAPLQRIQAHVAAMAPATLGESVLMQEMLRELNELYSARTSRLDAAQGHIPSSIWFVILAVGALTIGFGCLVHAESLRVHWVMLCGLTAALTLVVVLVLELDYPFRGTISVSAAPFEEVMRQVGLSKAD